MRNDEHEGAYIWLRQSARFGLGAQERTIEIAIPVRPGASPDEIEQLLREADAGMERLSLHLDQRIAALTGAGDVPSASAAASPRMPAMPTPPPSSSQPESQAASISASPTQPAAPAAPPSSLDSSQPEQPAATTSGRDGAAAAAPASGDHSVAESPPPHASGRPVAPSAPSASSAPSRPEPAAPAPANAPTRPPAQRAAPAAPSPAPGAAPVRPAAERGEPVRAAERGQDLTRAEFLAQAAAMGLNPKQVMERLSVRTLEGLNLREALELLRRQLVRDAGGQADELDPPDEPDEPHDVRTQPAARNTARAATAPSASSASREPTPPAPAPAPAYFDEEDDLDVSFALPEDEPDELETDAAYPGYNPGIEANGALGGEDDDPEDLGLDDVPELYEPDLAAVPPAPAPAAGHRSTASSTRAAQRPQAPTARQRAAAAEEPAPETGEPAGVAVRARAREVLEHLRAEPLGGAAGRDQLTAYRNIVVRELGTQGASALVRGIWRAQPERLGSDQMYALISWGKTDGFAEEARALLALLRAERAAAQTTEPAAGSESEPPVRQAGAPASGRGPRSTR